jgi:hypothetical protein
MISTLDAGDEVVLHGKEGYGGIVVRTFERYANQSLKPTACVAELLGRRVMPDAECPLDFLGLQRN